MIITKNKSFLTARYPHIWEAIQREEKLIAERPIEVTPAKNGSPTLVFHDESHPFYLHSRYNPQQEAEKVVEKYPDAGKYPHVFFYGIGLGYHVEAFLNAYPHLRYTLYEPDIAVFYHYMANLSVQDLPVATLGGLYVENSLQGQEALIKQFVAKVKEEILIVVLPGYEKKDADKLSSFCQVLKEAIREERSSFQVTTSFEKRWVINSIMNLPYTLKTPSILNRKNCFAGRPAIIVSAGPSLEEEVDRLRKIKEQGSAYIFAVGSANKALLKHRLYPDAVCSYDPSHRNHIVLEDIKREGIDTIPLIFGSTVGYETLENYPGPMFHMMTSQDTVAPIYKTTSNEQQLDFIYDAPSIAIIALQLLHLLECDPIILVGQNLAYKNDQFYSSGITYEYRDEKLNENELRNAVFVKDVEGNPVATNEGFNRMRTSMEHTIQTYRLNNVINTTKGGAYIEGTMFVPLEDVMRERLQPGAVSPEAWTAAEEESDTGLWQKRTDQINSEYDELAKIIEQFVRLLEQVKVNVELKRYKRLKALFEKLNGPLQRMESNLFYLRFVKPLNRAQHEVLFREMDNIRMEQNVAVKGNIILQHFGTYLLNCRQAMVEIYQMFSAKAKELHPAHPHETVQ